MMGIMAIQTNIVDRVALDRHAIGYARYSLIRNVTNIIYPYLRIGALYKLVFIAAIKP